MVLWRAAGINYVRYSQIAAQVTRLCSKKMVLWRAAGINYVRYSQIAAQVTRLCSKKKVEVTPRKYGDGPTLKIAVWENGKPAEKK
ncbi:hypothetical protein COOONC_02362 [Cooperia oncophora]